jgi:hypothetical protein
MWLALCSPMDPAPDARLRELIAASTALWVGSRQAHAASRELCQRSRFLSRRLTVQYDKSNDLLTRSRFHQDELAGRLRAEFPPLFLLA